MRKKQEAWNGRKNEFASIAEPLTSLFSSPWLKSRWFTTSQRWNILLRKKWLKNLHLISFYDAFFMERQSGTNETAEKQLLHPSIHPSFHSAPFSFPWANNLGSESNRILSGRFQSKDVIIGFLQSANFLLDSQPTLNSHLGLTRTDRHASLPLDQRLRRSFCFLFEANKKSKCEPSEYH